MRLPSKVMISGVEHKVVKTSAHNGGQGDTGKQIVTIGTKHNKDDRQFSTLVHEIAECSCFQRRNHYRSEDGRDMFVMTHKEFELMTDDIATALFPMVKK